MAGLLNGMLVRHAALGLGKVVAVEPTAVHVFFPGGDSRFAAKLRLPAALGLLRTDGIAPDPRLEGLTAFALDPKAGRYALAAGWMTHDEAVAQFLAKLPGGFVDPANVAGRPARVARWRAAHDSWAEGFGEGRGCASSPRATSMSSSRAVKGRPHARGRAPRCRSRRGAPRARRRGPGPGISGRSPRAALGSLTGSRTVREALCRGAGVTRRHRPAVAGRDPVRVRRRCETCALSSWRSVGVTGRPTSTRSNGSFTSRQPRSAAPGAKDERQLP